MPGARPTWKHRRLFAAALVLVAFVAAPRAAVACGRGDGSEPSAADSASCEPSTARDRLRTFAAFTLGRGTSIANDAHYTDAAGFDAGLNADYLHAFGRYAQMGIGLRYAYGTGTNPYGGSRESEHWAFVPFLLGWAFGSPATSFDFVLGVGWAGGALTFGAAPGKPYLYSSGIGVEASSSVTGAIGHGVFWTAGLYARVISVAIQNGDDSDYYMNGVTGAHGEAGLRVGIAFDL